MTDFLNRPAQTQRRHVFFSCRLRVGLSLLLLSGLIPGNAAEEKKLAVYSALANYTVPVTDRDGTEYVGLLELLDPLGKVSLQAQDERCSLRYNGGSSEFFNGRNSAEVRGQRFDLTGKFILDKGRGLVPISSLANLIPRILGGPVTMHEKGRRLFIGDATVHFTAQMGKLDPPTLVINFSSAVNPMISTEPGKLVMIFTRDPLVAPGTQSLSFDSKVIPSATFQESNGAALVTVRGASSLFASFSNSGRTITITSPSQTAAAATTTPAGASTPPTVAIQQPAMPPAAVAATLPPASAPISPPPPVRYFAVIDASHGGEERGEAITENLAEKDVTLAFARRLRQDLQAQGMPALLLRDADTFASLDQRAQITNRARPAVYICIHASSQGTGVRLYSSLIPGAGESSGLFADWNSAQSFSLPVSRTFATTLAAELAKKRIPVRLLAAPLRPLNNVVRPAIAIEIAPPSPGIANLNSPAYHELITASVSTALLAMRSQLEANR